MTDPEARAQSVANDTTVSVLMPSFNHACFIEEAVRSVWTQSYRNVELVVIDDGSSDGSLELLQALRSVSPINMIVEGQENQGVTKTLNRALGLASGDIICLLASDDFYDPQYVEKYVAAFRQAGEPVVLHCDARPVDKYGRIGRSTYALTGHKPAIGKCFEGLATSSLRVIAGSMAMPRRLLTDIGGYDESIKSEDFDILLRLSQKARFEFINEPLYCSRVVGGSLGRKPWVWAEGTVTALSKHRDALGERFDEIMMRRQVRLAYVCFVHGSIRHGLHWSARALCAKPRKTATVSLIGTLGWSMISGIVQHQSKLWLPDHIRRSLAQHLKKITRRLRANTTKSG
jgi:hypothetical protein